MKILFVIFNITLCSLLYGQDTISKVFFTPSLGFSDAININQKTTQPYGINLYQQINSPSIYASFGIEVKLKKHLYFCVDLHARSLSVNNFDTKMNNHFVDSHISNVQREEKSGHQSITGGVSSLFSIKRFILRPKISIGIQQSYSLSHKYIIRPNVSNYFTKVSITNKSTPNIFLNLDFDVGHTKIDFFYLNFGIGYGVASNNYKIVSTTFDNTKTVNYHESNYSQIYFNLSIKARLGIYKLKMKYKETN